MSYFNDDQRSYMRSMSEVAPEQKCWCCWYVLGECPHCPPGKTGADKMAAWCLECHSAPEPNDSRPIVHRKGCIHEARP